MYSTEIHVITISECTQFWNSFKQLWRRTNFLQPWRQLSQAICPGQRKKISINDFAKKNDNVSIFLFIQNELTVISWSPNLEKSPFYPLVHSIHPSLKAFLAKLSWFDFIIITSSAHICTSDLNPDPREPSLKHQTQRWFHSPYNQLTNFWRPRSKITKYVTWRHLDKVKAMLVVDFK